MIADDKSILGAADPWDVLRYRIFENEEPEDDVTQIWTYLDENFSHYCSLWSSVPGICSSESALQQLSSYSYGCCSDMNPLLEFFLTLQDDEVRRLWSTRHQAVEVEKEDGWRYIDADKGYYFEESLQTLLDQDFNLDGDAITF